MGNTFAYALLVLWPLLAIYAFKRYSQTVAVAVTLLLGFLILPVRTKIDLPFIPPLDKYSISVLALFFCFYFIKREKNIFMGQSRILKFLVLGLIIAPFLTVYNNSDPIKFYGGDRLFISGLKFKDSLALLVNNLLLMLPFFIGKRFFKSYDEQVNLFKFVAVSALVYSLFVLFEIRMSPQLHSWLYGYFPHDFMQQKREGGFRAVVFIGHGLGVAFFIVTALICCAGLWKNKIRIKKYQLGGGVGYLAFLLLISKSLASLLYGFFAVTVILFFKNRLMMLAAIFITGLVVLYPLMKITNTFPETQLVSIAQSVNPDRAKSLQFRFDHERLLLDKAEHRFWFGWGSWGRNRVFSEQGEDLTVIDGHWIIQFSTFGFFGFACLYGIMVITVLRANKAYRSCRNISEQNLLVVHAVLVAIIMVDQLPNSSLVPWYWLIIGALYGRSDEIIEQRFHGTGDQVA